MTLMFDSHSPCRDGSAPGCSGNHHPCWVTMYLGSKSVPSRARCLIRGGKPFEAREILEKFLAQTWPSRFGDVHKEARQLLKKIK